jgi:hypothetical protein
VGYTTPNDATMHKCYNKQLLSIKSGYYNERRGILSADLARVCVCMMCTIVVFTKETLFMLFRFTGTVYKG